MSQRRLTSNVVALRSEPTPDQLRGMAWWNALPEYSRIAWLAEASVGGRLWDVSAADAWAAYKETLSR